MTVFSMSTATTNAGLIVQAHQLGYITGRILDMTLGPYGGFWKQLRPADLTTNDSDPEVKSDHHYDFRATAFEDASFDTVVLDGPFKLNGTSTNRGPARSDDRYGVGGANVTWQDRHQLIKDGITESVRVLKKRGFLLVKMQDQVCSGQKRWQTREFADHAESLGCRLVDQLHLMGHRKQPPGRRQVHSAGNYSTLQIFVKNR